jgi:hypothetical protein
MIERSAARGSFSMNRRCGCTKRAFKEPGLSRPGLIDCGGWSVPPRERVRLT